MARWKARVDFLLTVIELLFLFLTVDVLQGKTCQNSRFLEGVVQFEPRFQGVGVVPGEHFLVSTKLDTFCYLKCKLHCATYSRFDTIPTCDSQTDGRTELL